MEKGKGLIIPQRGERALIVGATGSGKSAFARYVLEHVETSPIIIYDTKIEDKFISLPGSIIVTGKSDLNEALDNESIDYIIYRPPIDIVNDPMALDELLMEHYNEYHETVAYIDEIFQFHKGSRHGPGLMSLLTRGRSRGISTIMSSQRPSFLSRFCVTESQHFYVFRLIDYKDKQRLGDVIPDFSERDDPEDFGFWYYNVKEKEPKLYRKIMLAPEKMPEYMSNVGEAQGEELKPEDRPLTKLIWI